MPLFGGEIEVSDELLNDLRSKFLEEISSDPEAAAKYHPDDIERVKENDWFVAKYLLHQELDIDKALNMLRQSLQFRHEMGVNTLKKDDFPESYFEARIVQIYNVDKYNHPVLAIRAKAHVKQSAEDTLFQQYILYWVEEAIRQTEWGSVTILFDCTDVKYENVDLGYSTFLKAIFQYYYPLALHIFIIYNMPWYLTAIWQITKAMIPEKGFRRVAFVDKDTLLEYIDKDQLPICMGGTCTDQYDSNVDEETSE